MKTTYTYYKATHPESGKCIVGKTTSSMGQEIWGLIRSSEQSEFLNILRSDPSQINWETITKKEYDLVARRKRKKAVSVVSQFEAHTFESLAEAVKFLKGTISRAKIMKMLEDPTLSIEGYTIHLLEG